MKRLPLLLVLTLLCASCSLHLLEKQDDALEDAGDFATTTISSIQEGRPWKILLITDTHVGRKTDDYPTNFKWFQAWYYQDEAYLLRDHQPDIASETVPADHDFDAVIHLGDVSDDSKASQYDLAYDQYVLGLKGVYTPKDSGAAVSDGTHTPLFATPGNHDVRGDGRDHFLSYFGQGEWKLDLGDLSAYILDSGNRYFGPSQLGKLEDALEDDGKPKLFLSHMPLSDQDIVYFYLTLTDEEERAKVIRFMSEYDVRAFIDGHRHRLVGPYKIKDGLKEISLSCLNGPDGLEEQPPTWYVLSYDGDNHLEITQYMMKHGEEYASPRTETVLSIDIN